MNNLKIHPLLLLFAACLIVFGKSLMLLNGLFAVLIHEYAHICAAKLRGYTLGGVTLMPYGGIVGGGETLAKTDEIFIAAVGPLTNLLISAVLVAFWWIFPSSYPITKNLAIANFALFAFNALPCYPLDMSRIIITVVKKKTTALAAMRAVGLALGLGSFVLSLVSIAYTFNPNLMIIGVTLASSAVYGINKENEMDCYRKTGLVKNYYHPVTKHYLIVDAQIPIFRLMQRLSEDTLLVFDIVQNGKMIGKLQEAELIELATKYPSDTPIGYAIEK